MAFDPPSTLENLAGGLPTQIGLSTLAAFTGQPLLSLVPPLAQSLAARRQEERVKKALSEIEKQLLKHQQQINALTDGQFKLINETISIILQTVDEEKLDYLRKAAVHTLTHAPVSDLEAYQLARTIRDISAEEISFLLEQYGHAPALAFGNTTEARENVIYFSHDSREGQLLAGLIQLGVLMPPADSFFELNHHHFSPLASKLVKLLK